MAEKASAEGVAAAIRPPDYRKAVQNIRALKAKKEKIGGINGEIADAWAKIEGMKVNKTAGKFFAKLDALEPADRADVIRSFNGLADASGWEDQYEDLADRAEGSVVNMRLGKSGTGGDGEGSGGGDAGDGGDQEEPSGPGRGRRPASGLEALKASKARMRAGDKPAAGEDDPDAMDDAVSMHQ